MCYSTEPKRVGIFVTLEELQAIRSAFIARPVKCYEPEEVVSAQRKLDEAHDKLIKRVHASGERVVRDGNCEYRFYDSASAVINKVWMPLFKDSAA